MSDPEQNLPAAVPGPQAAIAVHDGEWSDAAIARERLSASQAEYARLEDTGKQIETKAQGTVAIAGIFLGFLLNFAKDVTPAVAWPKRAAAAVIVLLLASSVLAAMMALWVRRRTGPPTAWDVGALLGYLGPRDAEQRLVYGPRLLGDQCRGWDSAIRARELTNKKKADAVVWAQALLFAAVVLVSLLVVTAVLLPTPTGTAR